MRHENISSASCIEHPSLSTTPTMKRAGAAHRSGRPKGIGKDILSLASSDVKELGDDASILFQNLFGDGKDEREHLFRKTTDTAMAMHRTFSMQALISVAGLVRLYLALQSGSVGGIIAEGQAANSTSPKIRSADATFAAGSCACNLLFAIAVPPVLWLVGADFGDSKSILVMTSALSSLLGLLAHGLAVSFSCRSVTR